MTYLDEISTRAEPTMENVREEMKYKSQGWIPHSDIPGSLEDAFHLWDAVSWPSNISTNEGDFSYKGLRFIGE